jgi:SAM-dependent methyltransferase
MLTRSDVELAYRQLLGRVPKNPAVLDRLAANVGTMERLHHRLMQTTEYQKRNDAAGSAASPPREERARDARRGPGPRLLTAERAVIEHEVPPETLERLIAHVEGVWRSLGEVDPHWSVLTNDRYRAGSIAENKARFYASGERELKLFRHAAARNGIDLGGLKRCLEIGSGVGRITVWLATAFPEVVGCDISAPHLKLAEEEARARGLTNIGFRRVASLAEYASMPEFDAFFSVISLQHSPPPVQRHVLHTVLSRLRPGGVGYFQIPTQLLGYRFTAAEYLGDADSHEKMEMHCLPQSALFETIERAGCRVLEMRDDAHSRPAKLSNTLLVQKLRPAA